MEWLNIILVFAISAITVFLASLFAERLGLIAIPGEHRTHLHPTPVVGGIGIYVGLLVALYLSEVGLQGFSLCLTIMFFVGVLDDRFALPSWVRLLAQAGAAYLMVELTGVRLLSLGFIWSGDAAVILSDTSSLLFTVFATIGVINAINMSDGMDGLAGSLVLVVLGALIWLGAYPPQFIIFSALSVAGFLIWNVRVFRERGKIFMGDAGSTVLGLLLAYLLISNSQSPDGFPPVTALWLLTLPLVDAVAVLFLRPLRGQSPFKADNDHYHHLLTNRGMAVNKVLVLVLTVQIAAIMAGVAMWQTGVAERMQVLLFVLVFAIYFSVLAKLTKKS